MSGTHERHLTKGLDRLVHGVNQSLSHFIGILDQVVAEGRMMSSFASGE
jgi:hypothetical protein